MVAPTGNARLDSCRGHSSGIGGRHRADLPGTRYRFEVGLRRVHDVFAGIVRQFRLLPFGRLVTSRHGCATTHRPYEYLPADRRHLYAGLLCTRTVLAQFNHRGHVDLHYRGAHHSRHLDQRPTLALRDCVILFSVFPEWHSWDCSESSPYAGPAVVVLLAAGGACYIAGAIVYALRKPDPWPKAFGFHEIFHCGTVAGYACHMVAIYMVIVQLWP